MKTTQDAIQLISSFLSPASRFNLAEIDEYCFEEATSWRDVRTIIIDDDDVSLGSPNFVHKITSKTEVSKITNDSRINAIHTVFELCPALRRMIIQTRLREKDVELISGKPLRIPKLYISTENLSLARFPNFDRLRTLHIAANVCRELRVMNVVGDHFLKAIFPNSLRRVCITDVYLTDALMNKLAALPKLYSLDLIGCLVDTNVAPKYIPLLEKCEALEELSLPPSWFSFTAKNKMPSTLNLRNTKLEKLSLYIDTYDKDSFGDQLDGIVPKTLKILVLFGNYIPFKRLNKMKDFKNYAIIFGPNESIASCPQENLTNVKLLSHLVRRPPYAMNPNLMMLQTFVDFHIDNLSWRFNLAEWQANDQPPTFPARQGIIRPQDRPRPMPVGIVRRRSAPADVHRARQVSFTDRNSMRTNRPSPPPTLNTTATTNSQPQTITSQLSPIVAPRATSTPIVQDVTTTPPSELNRAMIVPSNQTTRRSEASSNLRNSSSTSSEENSRAATPAPTAILPAPPTPNGRVEPNDEGIQL
ncbi:unnamed protein product [Caenorhabditis bovis]|uniref:Uncharacterized protein n=1 Tax=Caenorhabditis bovis TaxID=2654633 RepID=A0A8S1EC01_9PELO|nr:unnamed protein product [Caenorhabditis bovis]